MAEVHPVAGEMEGIDPARVPVHIAVVMDGNGRWATQRGRPRTDGHAAAEEALFEVVDACLDLGVRWLTVYAFSTENWRRPAQEVRFLINFNETLLMRRRDELNDRGVRIRFSGRRDWRVPRRIVPRLDGAVELTAPKPPLTFTLALHYGGRGENGGAARGLLAAGGPAPEGTPKKGPAHP